MLNHPHGARTAPWTAVDRSAVKTTAVAVIPAPGKLCGAVWRYLHADGRRTAAFQVWDGTGRQWLPFRPVPDTPPSPEWADALADAHRWLEQGR